MAYSYTTYPGDGSTVLFAVPFGYLSTDHIVVTVDGVPVAFTWPTVASIQVSVAPSGAETLKIDRTTPITVPEVDYQDGSTLEERSLDRSVLQTLYIAQEAADDVADALVLDTGTSSFWDAATKKISNIVDGVADQDAATVAQMNTAVAGPTGPTGVTGDTGAAGADGADGLITAVGDGISDTAGTAAVDLVASNPGLKITAGKLEVDDGTAAGKVIKLNGTAQIPAVDGSLLTGIATGATDSEKTNIILNAFRIAVNGGLSALNMVDGRTDVFENETSVDLPTSTNEAYDATGDYYTSNPGPALIDPSGATPIGDMTGGAGLAAAFDGTLVQTAAASAADAGGDQAQQFIGLDWGSGNEKTVLSMQVTVPSNNTGHSMASDQVFDFAIIGHTSNAPASGTELGTSISGTISNTAAFEGLRYDTDASDVSTAYRYHWADINSSVSAAQWAIAEVQFFAAGVTVDMTLVSDAVTALAQPDEAFIVLWQEDVEAITLNTDLTAEVSRDGGATWDVVTLVEEATLTTGRILSGSVTLTSSGTSMKYRIKTLNTKEQRIHGVGLQWS